MRASCESLAIRRDLQPLVPKYRLVLSSHDQCTVPRELLGFSFPLHCFGGFAKCFFHGNFGFCHSIAIGFQPFDGVLKIKTREEGNSECARPVANDGKYYPVLALFWCRSVIGKFMSRRQFLVYFLSKCRVR